MASQQGFGKFRFTGWNYVSRRCCEWSGIHAEACTFRRLPRTKRLQVGTITGSKIDANFDSAKALDYVENPSRNALVHALEPSVLGVGFQVCIAWSSFRFLYRDGAVDNLAEFEHASEDFGIYIVVVLMLVGPSNTK